MISVVTRERPSRSALLIGMLSLAAALSLFRPWERHPLPIRDFGGTVAFLSSKTRTHDAYRALMDDYARDGRYQPVFMATFAAQWAAFRTDAVGWQVVRFALMTTVLVLTTFLAYRCGASWVAAGSAVAIWLILSGGHEAWYLLQVAEPVAALFIGAAAVLATYWRASPRATAVSLGIAVTLLCSVLSKETMVVGVPFVLGLALCRTEERWTLPELSKRAAFLVALVAGLTAVAVVRILDVRGAATASAYAARFDLTAIGVDRLSNAVRAIMLPVSRVVWFPANLAYLAVLLLGWVAFARRSGRQAATAAIVIGSLPLGGSLLYAAWPAFPGYYAMPFAIGMGVMFALALTWLAELGRLARRAALVATGAIALYGVALTWNGAQADRAVRDIDMAAVTMVAQVPRGTRVAVGVPDPDLSGGVSRALLRYAETVTGVQGTATAEDLGCEDARATRSDGSGTVVVMFSHLCGVLQGGPRPRAQRTVTYLEIDWKTFAPRNAEASVAVWYGAGPD